LRALIDDPVVFPTSLALNYLVTQSGGPESSDSLFKGKSDHARDLDQTDDDNQIDSGPSRYHFTRPRGLINDGASRLSAFDLDDISKR
jgi:hypothetical protein